jgi:RNA polymerase sigma factor (sigma-70 family)
MSPLSQPTEPEFEQRCLRGDSEALLVLYHHCRRLAASMTGRYCLPRDDAEDLGAEFYLYLIEDDRRRLAGRAAERAFSVWVYWRMRGFLSHAARRRTYPEYPSTPPPDPMAACLERWELEEALAQLSPPDRTLISLRLTLGLSYDECSQRLGLTPVLARKRYARARGRLRAILLNDRGEE